MVLNVSGLPRITKKCLLGSSKNVIPAQAGIQNQSKLLDSRLRGSDRLGIIRGTLLIFTKAPEFLTFNHVYGN